MKEKNKFRYNYSLLIDDNELDNFINMKIIESASFSKYTYTSTSGISALEFLKNITMTEKAVQQKLFPEVIFIDINMPLMDGFQFLHHLIKRDGNIIRESKLVILTTSLNPDDRSKAAEISENIIFLNKPLTEAMLSQI
jgi:CheY-like chemotaxis protein